MFDPEMNLLAEMKIEQANRALEEVRANLSVLRGRLNEADIIRTRRARERVRGASVLIVQAMAQLEQATRDLPAPERSTP